MAVAHGPRAEPKETIDLPCSALVLRFRVFSLLLSKDEARIAGYLVEGLGVRGLGLEVWGLSFRV